MKSKPTKTEMIVVPLTATGLPSLLYGVAVSGTGFLLAGAVLSGIAVLVLVISFVAFTRRENHAG